MEKRIIYGINPVREAIRSEAKFERLLISSKRSASTKESAMDGLIKDARTRGIRVEPVDRAELKSISGTENNQGIVGVMSEGLAKYALEDIIEAWKASKENGFILILDSIEDPQNMGTLIRSAEAAGVHGIIIPKDRSARITATVSKASAGAIEHVRIHIATNINNAIRKLKEAGAWVIALEGEGESSITDVDLDTDIALIIGSEGKGIRRLVKENSDICAHIIMSGKTNSLNAAQAGTIALFEARRQRSLKK
ncbi:MAG: 23S rRNA (guanosine(2251)-2'-O)-methyltransferase RlmB [Proteobacteria bacterium]|nr:23S rRNA (guanosine(2251)-2'-O)-methyltransferase RlmB [Pseudomonadota bacterium]